MFLVWVIFHVIVCFCLILVVLLQSSKGEGLAGTAFGGGGLSGAVFGGRGAGSFLAKATTVLAVLFMVNCVALAFISAGNRQRTIIGEGTTESVVTREAQKERERFLQQQQQQQPIDSSATDIQISPEGPSPEETADSTGL